MHLEVKSEQRNVKWFGVGGMDQGFSTGATERFSGGHEQRPLLNSSAVTLQNPSDGQGAKSVDRFWKGPQTTNGWEPLE